MPFALLITFFALAFPSAALAAAPRTFQELASIVVSFLNGGTALLVVLAVVIYLGGVSVNILKFSNEGGERLRAYFFWGIIALFVMVSVWGILRLLQDSIFGGASGAAPASQTPPASFQPPARSGK